jgi:hypothetical protein
MMAIMMKSSDDRPLKDARRRQSSGRFVDRLLLLLSWLGLLEMAMKWTTVALLHLLPL